MHTIKQLDNTNIWIFLIVNWNFIKHYFKSIIIIIRGCFVTQKRKASGQPKKIPNLNSEKLLENLAAQGSKTNREFDSKGFKHILDELEKNKQNVIDQNKIMEDIQNKMSSFGKEMNIKSFQNQDLNFDTNSKI